jgi:hypothetical protein
VAKQPEPTTEKQPSRPKANADIKDMVDVARKIKSKNAACLVQSTQQMKKYKKQHNHQDYFLA